MGFFSPRYFMILPHSGCQAACKYCFGPNKGEAMSLEVFDKVVDFIKNIAPKCNKINITFHGGEPLLAGADFYHYALEKLRDTFGKSTQLSIQSNLWALDDELCELIKHYNVSIGTSLDGFEEMCNAQRGQGYFQKTMAGIQKLHINDIHTNCICTFTSEFSDKAQEVFKFFAREGIPYTIHGAVPVLECEKKEFNVSVEEMERILADTLLVYKKNLSLNRVRTIDSMARGCFAEKGNVCTFFHCLGSFAAVDLTGNIYTCQRFCGHENYAIGNVFDEPSEFSLTHNPIFALFERKQNQAKKACANCLQFNYCKGGCLYNMFTANTDKDPYCEAYKSVFNTISRDMSLEMVGIMTKGLNKKDAPLLTMAGDFPHPFDKIQQKSE